MYNRKETIEDILLLLGFSPVHKGFYAIPEAVDILIENPGISMTTMYAEAGERLGANPNSTERSIRYAIETAMQECDIHTYRNIMGQYPPSDKPKPENGKFLYLLALRIKKKEAREQNERAHPVG